MLRRACLSLAIAAGWCLAGTATAQDTFDTLVVICQHVRARDLEIDIKRRFSSIDDKEPFIVSSDDLTNALWICGPSEKVALAKQVVRQIDVPTTGSVKIEWTAPSIRLYSLPGNNATAVARFLQEVYGTTFAFQARAIQSNRIEIRAPIKTQAEITNYLPILAELIVADPIPPRQAARFPRLRRVLDRLHGQPIVRESPLLHISPSPIKKDPEERRIPFEMREQQWAAVILWLTEVTHLPLISNIAPPSGTFTFVPPPGHREFTILEIIDIVNEGLRKHMYLLVRRVTCLSLVPTDEPSDWGLQLTTEDELPTRGSSEIVMISKQLKEIGVAETVAKIKPFMSPLGQAIPLPKTNTLVLVDRVEIMRFIVRLISELEKRQTGLEAFNYQAKYLRASVLERQIRADFRPAFENNDKNRIHFLQSDDKTNMLKAYGSVERIAQVRRYVAMLDISRGAPPITPGERFVKTFMISPDNLDDCSKFLEQLYRNAPNLMLRALPPNRILVFGLPEEHDAVQRFIRTFDTGPPVLVKKLIVPSNCDASLLATILRPWRPEFPRTSPYVDFNFVSNTLTVSGTAEQIDQIKAALVAMACAPIGERSDPPPTSLQIVPASDRLSITPPARFPRLRNLFSRLRVG